MNSENIKYNHFSPLENMLANIIAESEKTVWESIEQIKNALERCKQRKLFFEAITILKRK